MLASNLKEFSYKDLKFATSNFSRDRILGLGGFGKVYKGWIDEKTLAPSKRGTGMAVAVKKVGTQSMRGFEEWQTEVSILGRHYHPNIISLVGYCWEDQHLLLVYEFMQRGSLDRILFGRDGKSLAWKLRLKIALQVAQGLAFLHTLEKPIIHRGCLLSNILLDENYNVRLSGFSLAIRGPRDEVSYITTCVRGITSYLAPEYIFTGNLFIRSDVYCFGIVLFELLTGLKASDVIRSNGEYSSVINWLKTKLSPEKKLQTIMDVCMEGQYLTSAAFEVVELTEKCLASNPKNRPSIKEVVEVLKEVKAMEEETNNSNN